MSRAEESLLLYLNHFKGGEAPMAVQGVSRLERSISDGPKLLAEMRRLIRIKHYSYSTERSYLDWAERFIGYLRQTTGGAPPMSSNPMPPRISYVTLSSIDVQRVLGHKNVETTMIYTMC